MSSNFQHEIALMIAILAAAWLLKVVGVTVYVIWNRRRLARALEEDAQQAAAAMQEHAAEAGAPHSRPTPEHVIAALPVMPYRQALVLAAGKGKARSGREPADTVPLSDTGEERDQGIAEQAAGEARSAAAAAVDAGDAEQGSEQQQAAVAASLELAELGGATHEAEQQQEQDQHEQHHHQQQQQQSSLERRSSSSSSSSAARQRHASQDEEAEACAICLQDYSQQQPCIMLPCGHFGCEPCFTAWLRRSSACPLCKALVYEDTGPDRRRQPRLSLVMRESVLRSSGPGGGAGAGRSTLLVVLVRDR